MIREELETCGEQITEWTKYQSQPIHLVLVRILAHDAEQRAEIARWKHDYEQLKEAYDAKVAGVPLGPIVGAHTIINQQMEIAKLRAALEGGEQCRACGGTEGHWEGCRGEAALEIEIARLREALQKVDSLVKWLCGEEGEFGSEPEPLAGKYRRAFWWRTELRQRYAVIKQALKESAPTAGA